MYDDSIEALRREIENAKAAKTDYKVRRRERYSAMPEHARQEMLEHKRKLYADRKEALSPEEIEIERKKRKLHNQAWQAKQENKKSLVVKYRRKKARAVEYKGGACTRCGTVVHPCAFHFHHVDPETKEEGPGQLLQRLKWGRAIEEELDKCALVCANCHAVIHADEIDQIYGITDDEWRAQDAFERD